MCQRQFWMGPHRAGMVTRIWADCDLIHVLAGGTRIKTVRSHLSVNDLARLTAHGAVPAGPSPLPPVEDGDAVEVDRPVSRGGLIDEGEEPSETAVRELEEETGYRAGRVEHLITFQPMVGMVDSEHVVFTGRDPEKVGEPTETTEVERMEWVPLASVPGLIAAGKIWNSGTLVALLRLLAPQG